MCICGTDKLWSLAEMERTGGEPDVLGQDKKTGEFAFFDCSAETPKGRVSVCYDREGWESRKEHRPKTTAMDLAAEMGIALLTEEEYFELQKLGEFDLKTSSWIATPADIRERGGALYGERRYGRVFVGHNGAQSYPKFHGCEVIFTFFGRSRGATDCTTSPAFSKTRKWRPRPFHAALRP